MGEWEWEWEGWREEEKKRRKRWEEEVSYERARSLNSVAKLEREDGS